MQLIKQGCYMAPRKDVLKLVLRNKPMSKILHHGTRKTKVHWEQSRSSSYYTFPVFTGTQYILESLHHYSYLPWWATIACTTLVLRTVITLPLAIKQNKMIAKMELLKPTLEEIVKAVKENIVIRGQRSGKAKPEIQKELLKEIKSYTQDFYQRNGVSSWKLFLLPWTQLPIWITVSFALRNISGFVPRDASVTNDVVYLPSPGIETEGLLWFANLSVPDPYYVIPMAILVTNLINIELNAMRQQAPSKFSRALTNVFRGLTGLMFLVSTQVPSAMSLYWACSSSYGLTQNVLMKFPVVRRKLNIPKTSSEKDKPIHFILDVLKLRTKTFLEIQRKK